MVVINLLLIRIKTNVVKYLTTRKKLFSIFQTKKVCQNK